MIDLSLNTLSEIRELLLSALGTAIAEELLPSEPIPDFLIEVPNDRAHGDYASNVAMVSAKAFHKAPRQIAEIILSKLPLEGSIIEKAEVAGPGFINFFLSDLWYENAVKTILDEKENYGKSNVGDGKKVLVEFVSANPTGPMHIGNARGGALGDCLAAAFEWAGFETKREFYINDAGNQVNKFGMSLSLRYRELCGENIEMPEDSYHGQDIIDHAESFKKLHGDEYMNKTEEERRAALVQFALPLNIETLHKDLEKYRIVYDKWFYESELHNNGEVKRMIELLKASGYTYELEGALWFKATEFDCDKDFVLVRANGVPTYIVPDIAYHYNKLQTRQFDMAVNIWGADHHGYIPRLKAAMRALGCDDNKITVVLMQMVRLIREGEVVKASKRSGKAITLATLLDEVDIDAARFFFNLREPATHLDFDLDLAVEESSQNPVYYVQYAHARICSILRNLQNEGVNVEEYKNKKGVFTAPAEKELVAFLSAFTSEIAVSAQTLNPARITKYTYDTATLFHKFYNSCRVKGETEEVMATRIKLCEATKTVLSNALSMLKISAPELM